MIKNFFSFFLLLISSSWCACYYNSSGQNIGAAIYSGSCNYGLACTSATCSDIANACSAQNCSSVAFYSGRYYTNVQNSNSKKDWCNNSSNSNCGLVGLTSFCRYYYYCDTQAEADSLNNSLSCDSTKYTCSTRIEQNTEETSSDQITCIGDNCYGVKGCKYWSTYTTICINECGTNATQESYSTDPIFMEGACDSADFNGECTETLCVEIDDRYIIYQKCLTDNMTNGELEWIPKIQNAGKGSCASVGFKNTPLDSLRNSSSDSSAVDSISTDCLLYGACSSYSSDTTDYSNPFNRTSANGCTCEDDGGSSNFSRIVCPDGSMTYEIGTCDDWKNKHSSSSSAPPSSSSSAEGGGTSEAGGDWATNAQAEDIKDSLGSINSTLKAIGSLISALNPTWIEGETGTLTPEQLQMVFGAGNFDGIDSVGVDSVTSWADSLEFDSLNYQNVLDSMFDIFPTENSFLDTLSFTHSSKCPVFDFQLNMPYLEQQVTIDCASIGGFDLCTIGATILIAFATAGILGFQIKMIIRAFAGA